MAWVIDGQGEEMLETTQEKPLEQPTEDQTPLWRMIVDLGAQIPDEEWAKIPNDASINLDRYLYGPNERGKY